MILNIVKVKLREQCKSSIQNTTVYVRVVRTRKGNKRNKMFCCKEIEEAVNKISGE